MFSQLFPDYPTQSSCPLTVNYPDLVKTSHKGVIKVLVKLRQGFIYGEPTKVYLIYWRY